ncbi:MAG TPA: organomercurial lyase [Gaiellaceae bacterium]|nr:organomercurial lyase [Gaiellaceae bacterium]
MDERDLALRNRIYSQLVELGRVPMIAETGGDESALRRLHEEHALVLEADGSAIRMAAPFSGVPTPYRVEAGGREWFGNCAWDALGIPAALGVDGRVSATCLDCGGALEVEVRSGRPDPDDLVAHFLLPARRWWDDIVFT